MPEAGARRPLPLLPVPGTSSAALAAGGVPGLRACRAAVVAVAGGAGLGRGRDGAIVVGGAGGGGRAVGRPRLARSMAGGGMPLCRHRAGRLGGADRRRTARRRPGEGPCGGVLAVGRCRRRASAGACAVRSGCRAARAADRKPDGQPGWQPDGQRGAFRRTGTAPRVPRGERCCVRCMRPRGRFDNDRRPKRCRLMHTDARWHSPRLSIRFSLRSGFAGCGVGKIQRLF
ncbi:hypothetical protein OJJOAM_002858 [Cupriavidus sp. H18C1]